MNEYNAWSSDLEINPEALAALVIRLAGQVARTKAYPPPEGYSSWSDEAVRELANLVFERKQGRVLALKILERAVDQASLERLLLTTIENVLIDEAKGTETGKLRRRLLTVLGGDERFVHLASPDDCWALVGCSQELWQGDRDELIKAALAVRGYHLATWNTAGPTAAPVKEALQEVSVGVLRRADRAVLAQELALILQTRFLYIAPLTTVSLNTLEPYATQLMPHPAGTEDSVLLQLSVDEIWASLTPKEQAALQYVGQPPPTWARMVSMRPGEATVVAARVREKLQLTVAGDDQAEELILELRGRSIATGLGPPELRRLLSTDP